MNKTDLRVIKSKKNIRNAFLELMSEKDYQSITVKDISERALINRKTFYFHYETKDQLYNEIAGEIAAIMKPEKILSDIEISAKEEQKKIIIHFLTELKKYKNICIPLLYNSYPAFSNMIKNQLADAMLSKEEIIKRTEDSLFTFDFLLDTYFAIFHRIIQWWLKSEIDDAELAFSYFMRFFSREPLELLGIKYD